MSTLGTSNLPIQQALITNDATILGLLVLMLGAVFYTSQSSHVFWQRFYRFAPALLVCYFLPSLLTTFNIVNASSSNLYFVASRYLLPACLVLLTLSINLKAIAQLGYKALVLFLTGTLGIVIGGPIALMLVASIYPELFHVDGADSVWRGLTTVAGSWIGGGANQAAMKEVYGVGDQIFSAMVTVDIVVANIWMAVLLVMAANARKLDSKFKSDVTALDTLKEKMTQHQQKNERITSLNDLIKIIAVGLGVTGLAHLFSDIVTPYFILHYPESARFSFHSSFFWLIIFATTAGILLSFTRARKLEGAGASKVGSVFLYILIATIGMQMDIRMIFQTPIYFLIGIIWMCIHASLMLIVARIIKAPIFYMAVGSQANVGGAASAPIVASAFHSSLAPVGVLLAVLGYTLGTYMAWLCGQVLQTLY